MRLWLSEKSITSNLFKMQDRSEALSQLSSQTRSVVSQAEKNKSRKNGKPNGTAGPFGSGKIILRRTGQLPYTFHPVAQLGFATSYCVDLPIWYEINLWLDTNNRYVINIRRFAKADDEQDIHVVLEASSHDETLSLLEKYDPLNDITVNVDFSEPMSLAALTLNGLVLCRDIEITRKQYYGVLSELFSEMHREVHDENAGSAPAENEAQLEAA